MKTHKLFLDTDVVVNWLIKETETASVKELWKASFEIIKLVETKAAIGTISLSTLMEIRYLLRRKKFYASKQIENDLAKVTSILDVGIPDEINLLKANSLQTKHQLDPFDAIQLSLCISLNQDFLISRDKEFIQIAKQFITSLNPEEFLKICL